MACTDNIGLAAALMQVLGDRPTRAEKVREPNIYQFHFDVITDTELERYQKLYSRSELLVDPFAYIKDIHALKKMGE